MAFCMNGEIVRYLTADSMSADADASSQQQETVEKSFFFSKTAIDKSVVRKDE